MLKIDSNSFLTERIDLFPPNMIHFSRYEDTTKQHLLRIKCELETEFRQLVEILVNLQEQEAFQTVATFKIIGDSQAWICIAKPKEKLMIASLDNMIDYFLEAEVP